MSLWMLRANGNFFAEFKVDLFEAISCQHFFLSSPVDAERRYENITIRINWNLASGRLTINVDKQTCGVTTLAEAE
jgi:hypothetical protein